MSNADTFNRATFNSHEPLSLPLAHAHSENGTSSVTCPAPLWGMGGALRNSCLGMVGRWRQNKHAGAEGRRGGDASQAASVTGGGVGIPLASPSQSASSGARHQSLHAVSHPASMPVVVQKFSKVSNLVYNVSYKGLVCAKKATRQVTFENVRQGQGQGHSEEGSRAYPRQEGSRAYPRETGAVPHFLFRSPAGEARDGGVQGGGVLGGGLAALSPVTPGMLSVNKNWSVSFRIPSHALDRVTQPERPVIASVGACTLV
jgi:hypothetical protein